MVSLTETVINFAGAQSASFLTNLTGECAFTSAAKVDAAILGVAEPVTAALVRAFGGASATCASSTMSKLTSDAPGSGSFLDDQTAARRMRELAAAGGCASFSASPDANTDVTPPEASAATSLQVGVAATVFALATAWLSLALH